MSASVLVQSLMFAYIFWVCLSLGCVGVLLLHHMLRATWGLPILRFLEAGTRTLLPMAVLFFVLLFAGSQYLWPWANPEMVAHSHVLKHRAGFNNVIGIAIRSVIYFLFWLLVSSRLIASVARQDRTGDLEETQRRTNFAAPMMVAHILVITVAFTDWVMSLDPVWFSTIFGAWFLVSQALTALSFCTILITRSALKNRQPYAGYANKLLLRDLGNMMLGFTMMWAYFSLSQFLIIWSGNLPEETGWYATRMNSDWNGIGTLLVFASFFLPFLMLLYNHTKRHAAPLYWTAVLIFAVRILDMYWTIIPFFNRPFFNQHGEAATPITHLLPSLVMFVLVGAVWLVTFRIFWQKAAPLPAYDPRIELNAVNPDNAATGHVEARANA